MTSSGNEKESKVPQDQHNRDIDHLVEEELRNHYGLLNSEDHGRLLLRHDGDVDDLVDELQHDVGEENEKVSSSSSFSFSSSAPRCSP